jgi:MscS family membrane protein
MFEEYIINDYVRALLIFVSLFVLFRIILFVGERVFVFLTRKTKTKIDDILIEKLSMPLTYLSLFASLVVAVKVMVLSQTAQFIIENILYSLLIIIIARIAYIAVNVLVMGILKGAARRTKVKMDDTLFHMFNSLLNAVLIIMSLLYIMSIWGIEIGPLLAGLGIAGLAVALALQPILSNIFSGAAIILDGSVKVGDVIYLEGESIKGKIDKIGLRATRIRTFDNEYIIVPNNKVSDSAIQNIGLPEPKSRVVIPFGVAYGSNVDQVKEMILSEIKKIKNFDKTEKPAVRFLEMGDSSLNFKAYFYVESFRQRIGAKDEANTRIYNALNNAGIEIPFPQMDVNLKKGE